MKVWIRSELKAKISKKSLQRSDFLYLQEIKNKKSKSFDLLFSGARDRNRTGTTFNGRRILSPVRLPVPPLGLTTRNRIPYFREFVKRIMLKRIKFLRKKRIVIDKIFLMIYYINKKNITLEDKDGSKAQSR